MPAAKLGGVLQSLKDLVREIQDAVGPHAKMKRVSQVSPFVTVDMIGVYTVTVLCKISNNSSRSAGQVTWASGGKERADTNAGRLLQLHTLLDLAFPAERVVMGLRVCKLWHSTLLSCVKEVTLLQRERGLFSFTPARELVRSLRQFQNVSIRLDFEASSDHSLDELITALNAIPLCFTNGQGINLSQLSIRAGPDFDTAPELQSPGTPRTDDYDSDGSFIGHVDQEYEQNRRIPATKLAACLGH
eukprot:1905814-Rhodomonas_salina.1